jgi:hypothetical protein
MACQPAPGSARNVFCALSQKARRGGQKPGPVCIEKVLLAEAISLLRKEFAEEIGKLRADTNVQNAVQRGVLRKEFAEAIAALRADTNVQNAVQRGEIKSLKGTVNLRKHSDAA